MRRALTVALAAVFMTAASGACGAALAGAATVTLRIEGSQKTLFEGPVTTLAHQVDGGDGSGPHPCAGGLGSSPGPTAATALDDGARAAGIPWRGKWSPDFYDYFIESIGADSSQPPEGYWGVLVNETSVGGGCTTKVEDGDEVLWVYGAAFKPTILRLSGPSLAAVGEPFVVTVTAAGKPVANAAVGGQLTDAAGRATLVSGEATRLVLKAERAAAIRSNALVVCVGIETGCASGPGDREPRLSIEKFEPGTLFARGATPHLWRGVAAGVAAVDLQLTSRRGGRCRSWSSLRGRMVDRPCGSPFAFGARVAGEAWSARIGALEPGRYTLRARAVGGAAKPVSLRFRVLARRGDERALLRGGLAYLSGAQRRGGGLGVAAESQPSLEMTGWATLALAGNRPSAAAAGTRYLRRELEAGASIADQVRSAFAAAAAGADRAFTLALCRRLVDRRGAGGAYGAAINVTALAVLALRAGRCASRAATSAAQQLARERNADGGFGFRRAAPSDVDTTGLVTWALASVPATRRQAEAGEDFLRSAQNHDGGFGLSPDSASNSQSTGFALAGLRAIGIAAAALRSEDGIDPVDYLSTVQRGSGAISYSRKGRQTPVWTTSNALLGIGPRPFLATR